MPAGRLHTLHSGGVLALRCIRVLFQFVRVAVHAGCCVSNSSCNSSDASVVVCLRQLNSTALEVRWVLAAAAAAAVVCCRCNSEALPALLCLPHPHPLHFSLPLRAFLLLTECIIWRQ